jgi:MFS family permease
MQRREFTVPSVAAAFACWAGFVTGPNAMISATASFFMKPFSQDFHLNRTEVSLFTLISPFVVALFVPMAGRTIDRFGVRKVLIPSVIVLGLAQFLTAAVRTPLELAGAYFILSVAAAFDSSVGYAKVISTWFSRWRGLVLGLAVALGAGASSAAMPQFIRYLIEHCTWRGAYVGMGTLILVVGVPSLFFFLRLPAAAEQAARQTTSDVGFTRAEVLRKPTFWALFAAIFLGSMSLIGTIGHAFPMWTERGFPPATAATALSFIFIASIVGQTSSGFLADRFDTARAAMPYFACSVIGLLIEHSVRPPSNLLYVGALMHGLGQGGEVALAAYLVTRFFGLKHFGAIYSVIFAASNSGLGVGILIMGVCHDLSGSYDPMRYVFGAAMFVSFCLIGVLGPYRFTKAGVPIQSAAGEIAMA